MSETALFLTIQFGIGTKFRCQNSSISNNSVEHKYKIQISKAVLFLTIPFSIGKKFKSQKQFYFKLFSLA